MPRAGRCCHPYHRWQATTLPAHGAAHRPRGGHHAGGLSAVFWAVSAPDDCQDTTESAPSSCGIVWTGAACSCMNCSCKACNTTKRKQRRSGAPRGDAVTRARVEVNGLLAVHHQAAGPMRLQLVSIVVILAAAGAGARSHNSACPLSILLRPATGTVASLTCSDQAKSFDFAPADGDHGANRTLPGQLALGDLSLRVRPAGVQQKTVPPVPGLEPFPHYTQLSRGFGDPAVASPAAPWGAGSTRHHRPAGRCRPTAASAEVRTRTSCGCTRTGLL